MSQFLGNLPVLERGDSIEAVHQRVAIRGLRSAFGLVHRSPSPELRAHLELATAGHARHVGVMLFPELGLSSYAIDDLLLQAALLDRAKAAVGEIVAASRDLYPVLVVGAPLRREDQLFNTAVVIHRGRVLGAVPNSYLPNYREFYERCHFAPGVGLRGGTLTVAGHEAPFGADLLFRSNGSVPFTFHIEICEDIWVLLPPSTRAAMAGQNCCSTCRPATSQLGKRAIGVCSAPAILPAAWPPIPIRPRGRGNRRPTSPGRPPLGPNSLAQVSLFHFGLWLMPMSAPVNATTAPHLTTGAGRLLSRPKEHPLARLDPGLITGVADDAYALSETMGWKWGLELKAKDARGFYAVIAASVVGGLSMQYVLR